MIEKLQIFYSDRFDPYYNLAVEQHLMETVPAHCCILYLWQNRNTVVIGRNQNAWKECRTTLLEQENGFLARRLSGGGAVYHDMGNLNFTFLLPVAEFDLDRQLSVIAEACRSLGIEVERSGRNDILVDGKKFSGNAFYKNGSQSYHHGTLMVHVDKDKLGRYLSPSKAKLEAKGVSSVRSRVANLCEYAPGLTCPEMKAHMASAFSSVYGQIAEIRTEKDLDPAAVDKLCRRNASHEWIYGSRFPFTFCCEQRFGWGDVQLNLVVERGHVLQAKAFSDSMDWTSAPRLEQALTGSPFALSPLLDRIRQEFKDEPILCEDLCQMLTEQEI